MRTDLNKTLFMVKKMIKNADKNMLDKDLACKQLSMIVSFAKEEGMQSISKIAKKCLYKVLYEVYAKSLVDDFKKLMSLLQTKKEKTQVMALREARARHSYFKNIGKSNNIVQDLSVYDIIKVPTQGGMHYSVVTKVNKNAVECFPITTATEEQLTKIGCQYVQLQHKNANGMPLFLTSSKTKIPFNAAVRSYIRPYDNPLEIEQALIAFAN